MDKKNNITENLLTHKINKLRIYEEQENCAIKILNIFNKKQGPPILVAQMQQGKTGVCISVIDRFKQSCEALNKNYEIIYLINIADNDLKLQTKSRLHQAGLANKVKILHHSNLKNYKINKDSNLTRLIIIDECHIALGKSNQLNLKPFHEFCKNCGIKYGEHISTWENNNNFVLSVSATPYAHIIVNKISNNCFEPVILDINKNYYSLAQMAIDGRLHKSKPTVYKNQITEFLRNRISNFSDICDKKGPGYMIIRSRGNGPQIIEKYIKNTSPLNNPEVKIYDSQKDNIEDLDICLSYEPEIPCIIIIRGSLRAGKTLETTKYIHMWIDSPLSKTDATCQVIGRCLGFEMDDSGKNRKFQDIFPIYCNTKEINDAITFYNMYQTIPSGNWNKSTKLKNTKRKIILKILPETNKKDIQKNYPKHAISRCSRNNQNDIAKIILEKQNRIFYKDKKKVPRIFLLDAANYNPDKPKHADSWKELINNFPNIEGKYVKLEQTDELLETQHKLLRNDIIFPT